MMHHGIQLHMDFIEAFLIDNQLPLSFDQFPFVVNNVFFKIVASILSYGILVVLMKP